MPCFLCCWQFTEFYSCIIQAGSSPAFFRGGLSTTNVYGRLSVLGIKKRVVIKTLSFFTTRARAKKVSYLAVITALSSFVLIGSLMASNNFSANQQVIAESDVPSASTSVSIVPSGEIEIICNQTLPFKAKLNGDFPNMNFTWLVASQPEANQIVNQTNYLLVTDGENVKFTLLKKEAQIYFLTVFASSSSLQSNATVVLRQSSRSEITKKIPETIEPKIPQSIRDSNLEQGLLDVTIKSSIEPQEGLVKIAVGESAVFNVELIGKAISPLTYEWSMDGKILGKNESLNFSSFKETINEFVNLTVIVKDFYGKIGIGLQQIQDLTNSNLNNNTLAIETDYIIDTNGIGLYRAINVSNGEIFFISTNAVTLIQKTVDMTGKIYFTNGTYLIDETAPIFVPSNTKIWGTGNTTVFCQIAANSYGAIFTLAPNVFPFERLNTASQNENISIYDISFFSQQSIIPANAISITLSDNVKIERIYSYGMNKVVESHGRTSNAIVAICGSINQKGSNDAPFYTYPTYGKEEQIVNITFTQLIAINSQGNGISLHAVNSSVEKSNVNGGRNGIVIAGENVTAIENDVNSITKNGYVGSYKVDGSNSKNLSFLDCLSNNTGQASVWFLNVTNGLISGCSLYNTGKDYQALRLCNAEYISMVNTSTIDNRDPKLMNYDVFSYGQCDYVSLQNNDFTKGKGLVSIPVLQFCFKGNLGIENCESKNY
jgi:hypothetical protein